MNLKELYNAISSLESYEPSEKVDFLFSSLVSKVIDPRIDERLSPKQESLLQRICASAEYELEMHWSGKISGGRAKLAEFPYYENYRNLTRLEWSGICSCTIHCRHDVLFMGGGPLPMTAIILALEYGVHSTVIDRDLRAVRAARKAIAALGLARMIRIECADAASYERIGRFNVIFVAALAGIRKAEKISLFRHIERHTAADCHVIARSSAGKRTMLYAPLPRSIYLLLRPVMEITPYNEIINSVVILKNDRTIA